MGGRGFGPSPLFKYFFLTFNVKIMSKYWKRTIKQWRGKKHSPPLGVVGGGGGVSGELD